MTRLVESQGCKSRRASIGALRGALLPAPDAARLHLVGRPAASSSKGTKRPAAPPLPAQTLQPCAVGLPIKGTGAEQRWFRIRCTKIRVRRRKRVVIAEPGTDHRRTVHRFPCRRRFHGPPIDIDGAARLGVRHTADHPRELLPSTFAACSGVATFPRTCSVTTWLAEKGHRPPGRGPVVVPPPVRGGKGQR